MNKVKWDRSKGRPEPIRALNLIPELDNREPLVDIRLIAPSIKLLRPQTIPYSRETVAKMVSKAAKLLPKGYYLGLVEAWRPVERQQRIYDFMYRSAQEAFPGRSRSSLRRTVCRWVAPTDQKTPPGHSTGAAVDVWLVDETGEPLDVSSPYNRYEAAPTYAYGLAAESYKNRMILVETMLGVGFSNCRDEWWHYSYGDAGWAVRLGKSECFYGLAELDPVLYKEAEKHSIESFKERENPFLS